MCGDFIFQTSWNWLSGQEQCYILKKKKQLHVSVSKRYTGKYRFIYGKDGHMNRFHIFYIENPPPSYALQQQEKICCTQKVRIDNLKKIWLMCEDRDHFWDIKRYIMCHGRGMTPRDSYLDAFKRSTHGNKDCIYMFVRAVIKKARCICVLCFLSFTLLILIIFIFF